MLQRYLRHTRKLLVALGLLALGILLFHLAETLPIRSRLIIGLSPVIVLLFLFLYAYVRQLRGLLVGLALVGCIILFLYLAETRPIWSRLTIGLSPVIVLLLVLIALSPDMASLYGMSKLAAFGIILRTIFGLSNGVHIIEDGRTTVPPGVSEASIPGPRSVIVRCSVAVFYRGSQQTRISGPGFITTKPWEYVRNCFDLRPCQEKSTYDDVLTAEHIPIKVQLSVIYGINMSPKTIRGETPITTSEESMILRICTEMPDWKKVVQEDIEQSLRKAVARYYFNDLLRPASIDALSHQVRTRSKRRLHPSGIQIRRISILSIQPDNELLRAVSQARIDSAIEVTKASNELFRVANRARIDNAIELAKARTYRDTLRLIADAYVNARKRGMSNVDMQREILRGILEVLVRHDLHTDYPLTADTVDALMALRRHLGLRSRL